MQSSRKCLKILHAVRAQITKNAQNTSQRMLIAFRQKSVRGNVRSHPDTTEDAAKVLKEFDTYERTL